MALAAAALSPVVKGQAIAGVGFPVCLAFTWDNSYDDGGESISFAAYFGTDIIGAIRIADTSSDGQHIVRFVRGATLSVVAGTVASSKFQVYGLQTGAGNTTGALLERTSATDLSVMDAQRWMIWGW